MNDFEFKTEPFRHQLDEWYESRDATIRAHFWEMGTGKSKLFLDTAAWLYQQGEIDGALILAPNGVHRNWVEREIPAHLAIDGYRALCYETRKAGQKGHTQDLEELITHSGFAFLAMSYDSFVTDKGKALAKRFLTTREVIYGLDESRRIKSPGAKRTKTVLASAKFAKYRRILTGTPVANGPFDIYAPMRFLEPEFWRPHGMRSFEAFKTTFGEWVLVPLAGGRRFPKLIRLRWLDKLHKMIAPVCSRVTKDEVLDLPPKLYDRVYFDMAPDQRRTYTQLRDEYVAFLDTGEIMTAPLAITRELRLRQVLSGYLPNEEGVLRDFETNPRLTAALSWCEDCPHQAIIWANFVRDIDLLMDGLGNDAVRYDGKVGPADREEAINRFQAGKVKFFVANPAAGGMGLTLHAARSVLYYNNDSDLEKRLQSEDRAHRIGQEHPVNYTDLVCLDTVDGKIADALVRKEAVSARILGDALLSEHAALDSAPARGRLST